MSDLSKLASQMIMFKVLVEPQAASRPRFSLTGHTYNTKKYSNYKHVLSWSIKRQLPVGWKKLDGPISIDCEFFVSRPKTVKRDRPCVKPDLDNLLKAVMDSMNGLVWGDDSQICEITCSKEYSAGDPYILVTVGFSE